MEEQLFANIIVDVTSEALNKPFVYKIGVDLVEKVKPGEKVIFPFGIGNKVREGFILEILNETQLKEKNFYKKDPYFKNENVLANLKEVKGLATNKIGATGILLKMAIFMCKEYYCPIATCLNTVLPVKKVVRKNIKQVDAISKYNIDDNKNNYYEEIIFNDEQNKVANEIINEHKKNEFSEHLIYGVTGSGKTEVYIKIIEEVLKENKTVIVLIPEIALTHQTVIRLKKKFGEDIAIIHSKMSSGDKYIQYKKCEDKKAKILVGPRSAIFAPFDNLGLVVIDEINDDSYKSETNPRYNTIDVARFRCKEQNATLITLSATPPIQLYYEAINGKMNFHKLSCRANSVLPTVFLVDMKKELKKGNKSLFSELLQEKIRDRLDKKEQIMLYMNRRGYDTIFTCKECGETYKCPHCEVALVSHYDGKMKCHYCGFEIDEPMNCPICHSKEIEKYGYGTEKLEEMCIDLFPNARVLRMDRDTVKEKDGHDKIIEKFRIGEADILIGTQMIVKGHDFPNVTLVGVMRADLSLYIQSYKAVENTFSMLTQCVGRSGRNKAGEAVIQGYDIENNIFEYAKNQDFEKFYENEIIFRKKLIYPPSINLLYIKMYSNDCDLLNDAGKKLKLLLDTKNEDGAVILGPTKLNPEKIKDTYGICIYVKCKEKIIAKKYRRLANKFIDYIYKNGEIKLNFDIE